MLHLDPEELKPMLYLCLYLISDHLLLLIMLFPCYDLVWNLTDISLKYYIHLKLIKLLQYNFF